MGRHNLSIAHPITHHTPTIHRPSLHRRHNLRERSLDDQNFFRVEHGANNFTWSTSLAVSSLAWSKQCIWTHSVCPPSFPYTVRSLNAEEYQNAATGAQLPYGENVFGGYPTLADGIDGWGLERVNYSWNNPGFSESTGHFTQIVWKTSMQVGCSRTLCCMFPFHSSLAREWLCKGRERGADDNS